MAIETVNFATGGTATLITPFASEVGGDLLGDGILAELVTQVGTDAVAGVADQALIGEYLDLGSALIFASELGPCSRQDYVCSIATLLTGKRLCRGAYRKARR